MNKRGIELSINFLVIIIISLVILGGGIALLVKFIGGAEDVKADLDGRTKQELDRLLVDQGKQVALPLHTATVVRGKSHIFGLGVLNVNQEDKVFKVTVTPNRVIDEQKQNILDANLRAQIPSWLLYNIDQFTLKEFESQTESILIEIPKEAPVGQYILDVKVMTQGQEGLEQYGNTQKVYVSVK